jgi:hypothetical protein
MCQIISCPISCPKSLERNACDYQPTCSEKAAHLSNNHGTKSLIVSSLEIGRILAEKGKACFRASGTCMYPCVKPGDILHVTPRTIENIKIGDIAIFREGSDLLGHRTITKGCDEKGPYIVTKPDNGTKDDFPCYEDDVLGIISKIDRKGIILDPAQKFSTIEHFYFSLELKLLQRFWNALPLAINAISKAQQTIVFRKAAALFIFLDHKEFYYVIYLPLRPKQTHNLYRKLSPEEFNRLIESSKNMNQIGKWILTIFLRDDPQQVASFSFEFRPNDCPLAGWWVTDSQIRMRYRGTGIEENLLLKAEEIFTKFGISELWVHLPKRYSALIRTFRYLGFCESIPSNLKDLNNMDPIHRTNIVMRRTIPIGSNYE